MKRYVPGEILFTLLFSFILKAQTFTTSPFITLPGNNTDVDVYNYGSYSTSGTYLCWLNQQDTTYSIYVRRLVPDSSKNVLIYSGTAPIANPKIAVAGNTSNIRIAWQMKVNNHWQILFRELVNDSLTNVTYLGDTSSDNITPDISTNHIVWMNSGNIYYQDFNSLNSPPVKLDSNDCSNPDILKQDYSNEFEIAYEKGSEPDRQIYKASYYYSRLSTTKITNGSDNINPHFNYFQGLTFQTLINGWWHCVFNQSDTTKNNSCNFENPDAIMFPVLTKKTGSYTPFFMVFDSDSLGINRDTFFQTVYSYSDTPTDISNSPGDDYNPHIIFYKPADSLYIGVIWIHYENGKKDIWMAKTPFNPPSAVSPIKNKIPNFQLYQNYPNPFNPTTTISYQLSALSHVTLKVYDVLGREVAQLVNGVKPAGTYKVDFDAGNLASGIYFYQLNAGNYVSTKKLLLLK